MTFGARMTIKGVMYQHTIGVQACGQLNMDIIKGPFRDICKRHGLRYNGRMWRTYYFYHGVGERGIKAAIMKVMACLNEISNTIPSIHVNKDQLLLWEENVKKLGITGEDPNVSKLFPPKEEDFQGPPTPA